MVILSVIIYVEMLIVIVIQKIYVSWYIKETSCFMCFVFTIFHVLHFYLFICSCFTLMFAYNNTDENKEQFTTFFPI